MPVFTLHKYQPAPEATPQSQDEQETENKPAAIAIQASTSVSSLVAQALYSTMQRKNDDVEDKEEEEASNTQTPEAVAISTQDIEKDPVGALESVSVADSVIILSPRGFHTAKDEWLLSALEARKKSVFFSVESFLKSQRSAQKSSTPG